MATSPEISNSQKSLSLEDGSGEKTVDAVTCHELTPDDVGPPPDGGTEAWLCVAATFLILFCVFGFVTSMGQLETYYLANQLSQYSKSTVAWIASVQSTLTFIGSIFAGRYFDAHGARLLVIVGTTTSVASLVCVAFCKEYYQFFLAHALFGVAGSLLYSPATAVAGHWFQKRRSTAVGIIVCGSGLGGVIYPILFQQLFEKLAFRDAVLIVAGINGILLLPSWVFFKARLPPKEVPPFRELAKPWKDHRYVFLAIGGIVFTFNFFSPYFDAIILANGNNVPSNISAYSIGILQAGSFIGRGTAGFLADVFGVFTVSGIMGFSSSLLIFAFWVGTPLGTPATIIGMVLFGYTSGAWVTLLSATTGSISPPREFGMRLGMLWSLTSIPMLVGPVICGSLITAGGNKFTYAGIFCGITMGLGEAIILYPSMVEKIQSWHRRRQLDFAEV